MIAPFKSYQFPIEIGNSWITYPSGNSSNVFGVSPILVPAGRFFPSYAIDTRYNCGIGCDRREREWVAPLVGVVQKQITDSQLGINEIWRLIGYAMP